MNDCVMFFSNSSCSFVLCRSSRSSESTSVSPSSVSPLHRQSPSQLSPNHLRPPQTRMAAAALMRRHKSDYGKSLACSFQLHFNEQTKLPHWNFLSLFIYNWIFQNYRCYILKSDWWFSVCNKYIGCVIIWKPCC